MRILGFTAAFLFIVMLLIAGGIWAGYSLNTALQNRFSFPSQIAYKLNGMYNSYRGNRSDNSETVISNRLIMKKETVFLPLSATDFAGGIAAINGNTVLVTDRLGKLFSVTGPDISELALQSPDNKADQLREQLDEGLLGNIEVDFNWFRYNDILPVVHDGQEYLLASYTEWNPEELCFRSALARIALSGSDPATWTGDPDDWDVILRTEPCLPPFTSGKGIFGLEAGGRLDRLGETTVAWSSGSYERDDRVTGLDFKEAALAQNEATDYGKLMEVDFLTGEHRHLARGLRNPQGVSVDAEGRIWVTDHGMRGGDELNLVFEGANFGFPVVSYGTKYNREPAGNQETHKNHEGFDKPVVAFVPSIAPSSALAIDDFHYTWNGDVLVGALSGAVHRVHIEDGRGMYVEAIPLGIRIRDMAYLSDPRKIVLWSDDRRIVYLSRDSAPDPNAEFQMQLAELAPTAELHEAAEDTFNACLQCHGMLEGEHGAGPSLYQVCGREPGSSSFDGYSGALSSVGGIWGQESLKSFLLDTEAVAPGTTMSWVMEDEGVADLLASSFCRM
ncbi:MAG: PQQ-dependent sugar dehydrogenase [Marinibacterium profundimaris]